MWRVRNMVSEREGGEGERLRQTDRQIHRQSDRDRKRRAVDIICPCPLSISLCIDFSFLANGSISGSARHFYATLLTSHTNSRQTHFLHIFYRAIFLGAIPKAKKTTRTSVYWHAMGLLSILLSILRQYCPYFVNIVHSLFVTVAHSLFINIVHSFFINIVHSSSILSILSQYC